MYDQENPFANYVETAADASVSERRRFLHRTYQHLAGAILAFMAVEAAIFFTPGSTRLLELMLGSSWSWLIVMVLFVVVSNVANRWALQADRPEKAYLGLGLFVVAEALLFYPMLLITALYFDPVIIPQAAGLTLVIFGGLTAYVMISKQDFSFLRGIISVGSFAAIGVILASMLFGFSLGLLFSAAMVALAAGAILWETSEILHNFPTNAHVAASLALFSSVMLLFWYVLSILRDRD